MLASPQSELQDITYKITFIRCYRRYYKTVQVRINTHRENNENNESRRLDLCPKDNSGGW